MKKEIICTIGPASMNERTLVRLQDLGVSIFRINLSHTKLDDLANVISYIQSKTSVPICLDTEGAQIRTGDLVNNEVFLQENSIVRVYKRPVVGDSYHFNFYPIDIINEFKIGDFASIDFNCVLAQVTDKEPDCIVMRILTEGVIGQNKAVVIDRDIELPPLNQKDYEALIIGAKMGIRHVALSFAKNASDVDEIRAISAKDAFVISKIESINGVINLEEIAAKSDALLLDRGDLSRQVPIERIPNLQKDIIRRTKKSNAKIYVATNLLESMVTSLTPTRAEVNDIFSILNDDADGLVLASETAIGSYPVNCAMMVSKIIKEFTNFPDGYSHENLKRKDYFLLAEPHGGILIDRFDEDPNIGQIKEYKTLEVDKAALMDVEQIAVGTFSPLEGFMNKDELESVLRSWRLTNGVVWTMPIVLQTQREKTHNLKMGDDIALVLENSNDIYAILHLEDIYTYDLDKLSSEVFLTNDSSHPGVQLFKRRGGYFLSGKITLIRRLPSEYKHFEITPRQARIIFENKGWSRVVGFHTRNVIHRVHEHIQMLAFEKYNCDGLFVHPVVGPKKKGDYSADIILKSYELMMNKYYPKGRVTLGAFQSYSRYAGPREAVFTALCRKNFGCSHFIIGRDHTGVGKYYETDAAHRLFNQLGDIGITPIFFNKMYYCKRCDRYVEKCEHGSQDIVHVSGTEGRQMLKAGQSPPDWFMREEISNFILDKVTKGNEAFV